MSVFVAALTFALVGYGLVRLDVLSRHFDNRFDAIEERQDALAKISKRNHEATTAHLRKVRDRLPMSEAERREEYETFERPFERPEEE